MNSDPGLADSVVCGRIAAFALEHYSNERIPAEVAHEAKRTIINVLAASLSGHYDKTIALFDAWTDERMPRGAAAHVVWRGSPRTMEDAAFVNAASMHVHDYDDTYVPTLIHPASPVVGAALAAADAGDVSGVDLVDAVALGLQTTLTVSHMLAPSHVEARGFHISATCGAIGSCVAAALLLGLSEAQMVHALGIAIATASGLKVMIGSMTKSFQIGNAARAGVAAALLARRGVTSVPRGIEGNQGMLQAMSDEPVAKIDALLAAMPTSWSALGVSYKPYPTGESFMAPLDCTLNVRSRVSDLRARTADRMVLTVLPYMEDHVRRYPSRFVPGATVKDYRPDTPTSARFDMPYLMAASWYAGRFDERLLHPPAREDAQTLALRERIETVAEDGLEFHQARLDVFFADGTTEHEWVGANHGSPANPFQDQDFEAKFRRQAQGVIDDGAAAAVLDAAWRLDQLQHATELTSLLRAA